MGVLPMGINQLQRRDEVNSPSQLNFCLEAHYRMREHGVQALRAWRLKREPILDPLQIPYPTRLAAFVDRR